MKDADWCRQIEGEITDLKKRLNKLENKSSCSNDKKIVELDIELPEADIGGLHFNTQKVHSVFELKEDGNYYSRDILFNSARDTDKGTGRDLLSEYLNSEDVKKAFALAVANAGIEVKKKISVFLPKENQGVKKYNGVDWWYWLKPRSSGSSSHFCYVNLYGYSSYGNASSVGGCAPAFCVGDNQHE